MNNKKNSGLHDFQSLTEPKKRAEYRNAVSAERSKRDKRGSRLKDPEQYYVSSYDKATIDDYYSVFNDVNDKYADPSKRKKIRFKDLSEKYKLLKFQSFSLLIIIAGLIVTLFVLFKDQQDFVYKTLPVLANNITPFEEMQTVVYDKSNDITLTNTGRIYEMRYISQIDEGLPNGCESVALAMSLSRYIRNISPGEIVKKYLPRVLLTVYDGVYLSEDPTHYYVGDPAGKGYGIFAEGLAKAAENTLKAYKLDETRKVINISGCSEEELFGYVNGGDPVIVWCTMNLLEVKWGIMAWHLPNGERYKYPGNQHCSVLVSSTDDSVTLYDPTNGIVTYDKALFLKRWNELGPYPTVTRQAIVIK